MTTISTWIKRAGERLEEIVFDHTDLEMAQRELRKHNDGWTNTAYLLVDMQEGFLYPNARARARGIIHHQEEVLGHAKETGIPVVALEYEGKGETIEPLRSIVQQTPTYRFFTKDHASGLTSIELVNQLVNWQIGNLFVMGINATRCVLATASDAHRLDLGVATSEDVTANVTFAKKRAEVKEAYEQKGVLLAPTHQEALAYLTSAA